MAKLPTADERQISIPQASMGVVGYNPAPSGDAAMGRAIGQLGDVIQVEADRWDKNAAENAFTKIRQGQLELASGDNGYLKVRGEAAVKGEVHKKTLESYDKMVEGISIELGNDRQRGLLKQRADIAKTQLSEGVLQHVMQQEDVAFKDGVSGRIEVENNNARMNALNPAAVAMSAAIVGEAVRDMGERYQWPADKVQAESAKQVGAVHETVITAMIEKGHDLDAQTYYDKIKNGLSADADERIAPKLKAATTDGKAFRAVDEIWSQHGPTRDNDPVRVFSMEQAARAQFRDDPQALKAAIGEIRSRAAGFNAQQTEVKASNVSQVMDAFNNGVSLMQIKKSSEFQSLTGDDQTKIIEHIIDRGYTLGQRAKSDKASLDNNNNWTTYWDLTRPGVLDGMSEIQVMSLSPTIGWPLTNKLMEFKRGKSIDANIDSDLFNRVMQDAGFDPYSKKKDERANLGRMRDHIESIIAVEQKKQGGKLSRDATEKIAQSEIDRKVIMDQWGPNTAVVVGMITPEKRKDVYVSIDQIPPDQLSGLVELMRSRGKFDASLTNEEAMERYEDNLQRAYGRFSAGGTQQEVLEALDGR